MSEKGIKMLVDPLGRAKTVFAGAESRRPVKHDKKSRSRKSELIRDRYTGSRPEAGLIQKTENRQATENIWELGKIMQKFPSSLTSINAAKMPAAVTKVVAAAVKPGDVIADIGGGRFDNVKEWAVAQGAVCYIIDPYNRSREENLRGIEAVKNGKADIAMANNVLNVIKEPENRERVVRQVWDALKPQEGTGIISIYEGDQSAKGRITRKLEGRGESWQEQRKSGNYFEEIAAVTGKANLTRKGNTFILKKPRRSKNRLPQPAKGRIDLLA